METQYEVLNEENTKFVVSTWLFSAQKERNKRNWQRNRSVNRENDRRNNQIVLDKINYFTEMPWFLKLSIFLPTA
jgi:hypothetical protein